MLIFDICLAAVAKPPTKADARKEELILPHSLLGTIHHSLDVMAVVAPASIGRSVGQLALLWL